MCNLYRLQTATADITQLFDVADAAGNAASSIYPGYSGLVVVDGTLRSMVWGFPLAQKSKRTGKPLKPRPVNNARTDKLDSFFWRSSFAERRCLIPLTAWAEAEGVSGSKTRTWMSLPDDDTFAVAGLWRSSGEWGQCYSMVMTDAEGPPAAVHNRMPVILRPEDYQQWQDGSPDEARSVCKAYDGVVAIDRTATPWTR